MGFYDLDKNERTDVTNKIFQAVKATVKSGKSHQLSPFFADADTYIRKNAYMAIGKLYKEGPDDLESLIRIIQYFLSDKDFKCRQTAVNAAGEIGKFNFA